MKDFNEFKKTLSLGQMAYDARQKAIKEADEIGSIESWEVFVRESTSAYMTLAILEAYHDWIQTEI